MKLWEQGRSRLLSEISRLKGIGGLKVHPARHHVASTPHWVLARRGRAELKYFKSSQTKRRGSHVFIVPSLINRYYILDLYPGCSLIEALVESGIDVYLLDWGNSREQDQFASLEDHVSNWLRWAHLKSCEHAGVGEIAIFGQCIGGTLAAIYASIYPESVSALSMLTTPIDFENTSILSHWAKSSSIDLAKMGEVWGNISGNFLAQSFKLIEPLGEFRKYQMLFKYGPNKEFIRKYVAMECWLKDAIHFPGKSYSKFIQELYRENRLVAGSFEMGDQVIDLSKISCPILNLYCAGDVIVPPESSMALKDSVSSKDYLQLELRGGHIGCLISDKHKTNLWATLSQWLHEKQPISNQKVVYA